MAMSDGVLPRPLTALESGLIRRLLSQPFPGREKLLLQLNSAVVSGTCSCGCPSVTLTVKHRAAQQASVTSRVPIEAVGLDSDGAPVHVLLHVAGGVLCELEVFREDSKPLIAVPDPSSLRVFSLFSH